MAAAAAAALPVVDLQSFDSVEGLAQELIRVGKDPGFFYVVGHGLGDGVAADMFALAETFFGSPLEEKLRFANGSGDLGYTGMREETLSGAGPGDVKESFYLSDPGRTNQVLPAPLEAKREKMAAFFAGCDELAKTLLEALAVGLGMPRDFLSKAHTGESCRMRLINYPPVSQLSFPEFAPPASSKPDDIRAGAHSDYGSLTLLFRQASDQGGLQPDRHVLLEPIKGKGQPVTDESVIDPEFLDVLKRKGYESAKPVTSWEHLGRRIRATYGKT
ncbi:hypothetical protein K4K61_013151 [Colletotrichum sp. SAR11_59]|nr:hypothetical protein K4K61_013151 [Colletotrichum sp. SAR11_59]